MPYKNYVATNNASNYFGRGYPNNEGNNYQRNNNFTPSYSYNNNNLAFNNNFGNQRFNNFGNQELKRNFENNYNYNNNNTSFNNMMGRNSFHMPKGSAFNIRNFSSNINMNRP